MDILVKAIPSERRTAEQEEWTADSKRDSAEELRRVELVKRSSEVLDSRPVSVCDH